MEIGKFDWDLMFLDFIKLNSRSENLESLNPYYDALSKENKVSKEYSSDYVQALKKVSHLENKRSLTEDEFIEWEGTVGWYENIWEEIGFREESLATGLIIAIWKLVNHLATSTSTGLVSKCINPKSNKFTIFKQGPMIGNEYWALCMNAASNYVRHADDWNKNLSKFMKTETGNWKTEIPDKFQDTKLNLEILENIGLKVEDLISSNDKAYEVANKLGILDQKKMNQLYSEWVSEVYQYCKTILGK